MMKVFEGQRVPIKAWIDGVECEEEALKQVVDASKVPFIFHHIALMPDVHSGIGCTVGAVLATKGAIIPATVGVDIGCGMIAARLNIKADMLSDKAYPQIREAIEKAVPHGRTDNGGKNDRGAWHDLPKGFPELNLLEKWRDFFSFLQGKHPGALPKDASVVYRQLCTLGTGNHFIELCYDEENYLWIMLHSGSRGIGNRIGTYFIGQAYEQAQRYGYAEFLPNKDLAWLNDGTDLFKDYVRSLHWAQEYAALNRTLMLGNVFKAISSLLPENLLEITTEVINCHHNYASMENHFGQNVWVTRKGAVRARKDELGIIPGSMGAKSYIVRGKGNFDSFQSCSHGAGRRMSRTKAKSIFTIEDHIEATKGVECRKDKEVLDETPGAYKDIDSVIAAEQDLVSVVHTFKQLLCVKG